MTPSRTPAQRAAYTANAPATKLFALDTYVDQSLVGAWLYYPALGIRLDYRYSFVSPLDGEVYHGGVVGGKMPGCGVLLGSSWSWKAKELRRL